MTPVFDLAIVGAGAAGLTAAIAAGERAAASGTGVAPRILLLEGARRPGAKILVSGGGRCNVTNVEITPADYHSTRPESVRRVLSYFDLARTLAWFDSLGVELKLEPTGKYFPTSDKARTVLDALLARVAALSVELRAGHRVERIMPPATPDSPDAAWLVEGRSSVADGTTAPFALRARRVVMATGGLSLPKSGSDGAGLRWLAGLGHTVRPLSPALAPLVFSGAAGGNPFADLSGLSIDARLSVRAAAAATTRSAAVLFTHFGASGPAPMDISRHVSQAMQAAPAAPPPAVTLAHPDLPTPAHADRWLLARAAEAPRRTVAAALGALHPERFARLLAGEHAETRLTDLARETRLALATRLAALPLPVTGDRGYTFAETTAGGVDLAEIDLKTMESRKHPGLHLAGELLDADGRIGGFNFQWAWTTGWLAGRGAMAPSSPNEAFRVRNSGASK